MRLNSARSTNEVAKSRCLSNGSLDLNAVLLADPVVSSVNYLGGFLESHSQTRPRPQEPIKVMQSWTALATTPEVILSIYLFALTYILMSFSPVS